MQHSAQCKQGQDSTHKGGRPRTKPSKQNEEVQQAGVAREMTGGGGGGGGAGQAQGQEHTEGERRVAVKAGARVTHTQQQQGLKHHNTGKPGTKAR